MTFFSKELPSDGSRTVRCRPYTIADAMSVSGMNSRLQEAFATRFLELIQTGESPIDPRREMTVEDRQSVLFHYALAFLQPERLDQPETYNVDSCPVCGEKHSFQLSLRELASELSVGILEPGEAVRITELDGQKLAVTPLRGEHVEHIEFLASLMVDIKEDKGEFCEEFQQVRVDLETYEILSQISLVEEDSKEKDAVRLKKKTEAWFKSLSALKFQELFDLVEAKHKEMEHGVRFVYDFPCPNFKGEDSKEGLVACRLPFQPEELIPRI